MTGSVTTTREIAMLKCRGKNEGHKSTQKSWSASTADAQEQLVLGPRVRKEKERRKKKDFVFLSMMRALT